MMKRLVWWSSGYVAGAASSWWVQRKVRRTAARVLPEAVRNEVTTRIGDRAASVGRSVGAGVDRARSVVDRARPATIDLRSGDRAIS